MTVTCYRVTLKPLNANRVLASQNLTSSVTTLLLTVWGYYHRKLSAFHFWKHFNCSDFSEIIFDPLQKFHAELLVGHFATSKSQSHFGLIPIIQETCQVA